MDHLLLSLKIIYSILDQHEGLSKYANIVGKSDTMFMWWKNNDEIIVLTGFTCSVISTLLYVALSNKGKSMKMTYG